MRISKEIVAFVSGKDESYAWDKPKVTEALTEDQKEILEKRGVLSPTEIHQLASKTRAAMGAETGHKAACHSDLTEDGPAKTLQEEHIEASP